MSSPALPGSSPAPASASPEPLLAVRGVVKRFGKNPVLRGLSLTIAAGEFLTILGESGSGKTTLLRLIAGFERADEGEIWMAGARLDGLPPFERRVNTVFQHYALFPHLSVFENVAYGLRVRRVGEAEVRTRVSEALAMVKMGEYAQARPGRLSGGQKQRVALARALVGRPELLLLDEPLSALDANLRREMQHELKALQRQVGIAFVLVTHDQDEAMALSDRIALLRAGRLEQVDTPREIYRRPATTYAATFIGRTNLLPAEVRAGVARCGPIHIPCALPEGRVTFSLRPEELRLAAVATEAPGPAPVVRFRAAVRRRSFQGASELWLLEAEGGLRLEARLPGRGAALEPVDASGGAAEAEALFEFDAAAAVPVRASEDG